MFQTVIEGWDSEIPATRETGPKGGDWRGIRRAIEAQVAAAALGYKPLYYDPWPAAEARALARLMRGVLPRRARVAASELGLFIWRTRKLRAILDADPEFYRPGGLDDWAALQRATMTGMNGEMLGYGARSFAVRRAARVTIHGGLGVLLMFFVSDPSQAEHWAAERALDIQPCVDFSVSYTIEYPAES